MKARYYAFGLPAKKDLGRCRSLVLQAARRTLRSTRADPKSLWQSLTQEDSGLLAGSCANGRGQVAEASHEPAVMIDAPEKRLIEALKSVDAHGDVAPAHIHDPMTMLLRENAVQTHLMRWDDGRGRYVLTGTGRRRISTSSRAPGTVVSFRNR